MPITAQNAGVRRGVAGFKHLEKFAFGPRSAAAEFLYFQAWRDVDFKFYDFDTKALDTTNLWTTNAGTGATAFAIPGTLLANGTATGATGTNATASNRMVNFYGSRTWQGDKNCGMEVRFKFDAVTSLEFFLGFIDTHTTITTPVALVSDIDTPSFASGMGDAALVGMDTSQTLTTMALACLGSNSINTSGTKDAIGTLTPTAATYMTVRIQLSGGNGTANGNNVTAIVEDANASYTVVNRTAGIEGGTLLQPIIQIAGLTATSRTMDVDYLAIWQDR